MTDISPNMAQIEIPDQALTNKIVTELKSQGIFDEFRRECMADVDTKPAYQNLRHRVEGSVRGFLKMNPWKPDMNKNQLRDNLRKHILRGGFLDIGVDRIVDQVVNPKIYSIFLPKVAEVVHNCLGDKKDKPMTEPSPQSQPEPSKFQSKHNLVPRAILSGPRMSSYPIPEILKPKVPEEEKSSVEEPSSTVDTSDNESFVLDGDINTNGAGVTQDDEDYGEEDDEESPPFEPHSESDNLILGIRTDSSDSTDEPHLVTTIVDDSLEERIDINRIREDDIATREEEKEDEIASDNSIPKTPTIKDEEYYGMEPEYNSDGGCKRYQIRPEEESLDNMEEEVVTYNWTDESATKSERSSNEGDYRGVAHKRKLDFGHFEEKSSSSFLNSSCDEDKYDSVNSTTPKKIKFDEDDETTNEQLMNEDSNTDWIRVDSIHSKQKQSTSTEYKDRGCMKESISNLSNHRHQESHKDSYGHHRSSSKKKHTHKDQSGEKEEKVDYHSSHKHRSGDDNTKSPLSKGRSKGDKSETSNDNDRVKESTDERQAHNDKSRNYDERGNKKRDDYVKHSSVKKEQDFPQKHRDSSTSTKHSHSHKHSHKSSHEKRKSSKEHKSKDSSSNHNKKSDKHSKQELAKKKRREYCKSYSKDFEGRRSSDRDSNGPGGRSQYSSSTYRSSSVRNNEETSAFSIDKTSNSDDNVSERAEHLSTDTSADQENIASPDTDVIEEWNLSDFHDSNLSCSVENDNQCLCIQDNSKGVSDKSFLNDVCNDERRSVILSDNIKDDTRDNEDSNTIAENLKENVLDDHVRNEQDISTSNSFIHDTSSEKENIDYDDNLKKSDVMSLDKHLNEANNVVKFKKPKIAANIFEVKRILKARRNAERMEKKRMKLLMKANTQDHQNSECTKGTEEQETFLGFFDVATNKLDTYNELISRLTSDMQGMSSYELDSRLIIHLLNVYPDLDDYMDKIVKRKVNSKIKVRVPPISEQFYEYDEEQNSYILTSYSDEFVDYNLNNLNPNMKEADNLNNNQSTSTTKLLVSTEVDLPQRTGFDPTIQSNVDDHNHVVSVHNISKSLSPTLQNGKVELSNKNSKIQHKQPKKDNDIFSSEIPTATPDNVEFSPKFSFSLTFDATYEDILNKRNGPSDKTLGECKSKAKSYRRTVVKITNDTAKEQIILKPAKFNDISKAQVTKITRSEAVANGKLTTPKLPVKQIPLITRINKSNNVVLAPPSNMKAQRVSGIVTTEAEVTLPDHMSSKTINDNFSHDSNAAGQILSGGVICLRQRGSTKDALKTQDLHCSVSLHTRSDYVCSAIGPTNKRVNGLRQQQCYSSEDLYKPRLQLTSRRVRGQASPEMHAPTIITRKRTSVTLDTTPTLFKRKR